VRNSSVRKGRTRLSSVHFPMTPQTESYRVPSFWKVQTVAWLIYWGVLFVTFLPMLSREGQIITLLHVKFARAVFGFTLTSLLHPFYRSLAARSSHRKIIWTVLVSSVVMGIVWLALADFYKWLTTSDFTLGADLLAFPRSSIDYSVTIAAWSSAYFGFKHWQQWQIARDSALQSQALANQARLEVLRYQLQPHFLFNALNSVRALSSEDPQRAGRMVTEFSEFLRYSLVMADRNTVDLNEEVAAIRSYLAVEAVRFENKLAVKIEVSPDTERLQVPVLLLHPLVENAIKHGFTKDAQPLCLRISTKLRKGRLLIEIANTGHWREKHNEAGTGTGLRNVKSRLEQTFPGDTEFEVTQDTGWIVVRMELPARLAEEEFSGREFARAARG
jgi:two-component system, LytTR family, sensor kinase